MPMPHSKILDLLEADPVDAENARVYAENAENAVSRSGEPITAFRSFSASIRVRESEPAGRTRGGVVLTCYTCRGTDFWVGRRKVTCRRCHPPAPGAEVLTPSGIGSGTPRPVEIEAGSSTPTPETRTHGVRGGAA
jgi:hypothetical protein